MAMNVNISEMIVLSYFCTRLEATVPELSAHTNVHSSTIVGIVSKLERKGLVSRSSMEMGSRGRPKIIYRLNLPEPVIACIIDGTQISGALLDKELQIQCKETLTFDHINNAEQAIHMIKDLCERLLGSAMKDSYKPQVIAIFINAVQTAKRILVSSVLPWAVS